MAAKEPATASASGFASPQEEVLLNLFRSADALQHALQQRLKPFGITGPQYNVLRILRGAHPRGLMCSAIGRMMISPEPDMTRLLARLKAHKLVTQRRDKHDGRVVLTHLSAAGMATLAELDGLMGNVPVELLRAFDAQELREFTRLLVKARCCSEPPLADPGVSAEASAHAPGFLTGTTPQPR